MEIMLMSPATGEVATLTEWEHDYLIMSPEEWGGLRFEDAELVEVELDKNGKWIKA